MPIRRRTIVLLVMFLSTSFIGTAFAHHGAGTFVLSRSVQFKGKLTAIELINPHSWLYFEAADANGKVGKYRCEMRSLHTLRRSGWTKDLFPIGQKVQIEASPDSADPNSCYLQTILFENGSRMDRYGQYIKGPKGAVTEIRGPIVTPTIAKREPRRPTGEPNIAGDWAQEQRVMADPRGVGGGLVRLSTIAATPPPPAAPRGTGGGAAAGGAPAAGGGRGRGGAAAGPRLYGGTELTELGTQAAAAFVARTDNPRFNCQTTSILFDWTFDGAVNRITQSKDTIVLTYGQFNLKRTIHMNLKQHPADIKPSRAGHSIGRWEGDVLVVDTVGFLPGFITTPVRHGDKLHVVERFSLDPKTMVLTRSYEAEDPVYLKSKYTGTDDIQVADVPYAPEKCKEQQFVDYSKEGQVKR
jgi:hypothetical protein